MMKRLLLTVFALSMILVLFSCGEKEESENGKKAASEKGEKVVRIAGFGGIDQNTVEALINKFVDPKLPNVKVVYEPVQGDYMQVLLNTLSAGTAADVFYMDIFWAKNVIGSGAVEPLNDYLRSSSKLSKSDIIDSLINAFEVNGKVYGIPKDFNTLALFYNKDIFDEAGVEYPSDEDTWDDLEKKIALVKDAVPDVEGIALPPDFARMGAFAYATGWKSIENDQTDLLDSDFKRAFNYYVGLKEKGLGIMPGDIGQGWGGGAFATENVAMCLEGAWILGFLKDSAPNLNYAAVKIPKDPKTKERGNLIFTVSYGINAKSKVKKEAFEVIELLTSEEAQQYVLERGLAIPSRKSLADNEYFENETADAKANLTVFEGATDGFVYPYYFGIYGGDWMQPINTALSEVLSGQKNSEEALKTAQEQLILKMKEINSKINK